MILYRAIAARSPKTNLCYKMLRDFCAGVENHTYKARQEKFIIGSVPALIVRVRMNFIIN